MYSHIQDSPNYPKWGKEEGNLSFLRGILGHCLNKGCLKYDSFKMDYQLYEANTQADKNLIIYYCQCGRTLPCLTELKQHIEEKIKNGGDLSHLHKEFVGTMDEYFC